MEDSEAKEIRLFNPIQIGVAAFLGAPLAACWLFSRNLKSLGDNGSAKRWMIGGIVGTMALFVISYFLPEHVPNQVIPIGYTIGLYQAGARMFGATIDERLGTEGAKGSWWTVIAISIF